MIKYALTLAIALQSIVSFGQDFYGIKPIGNKDYTVNQFKAKGFKYVSSKDNLLFLEKTINGEKIQLLITYTNKTKQVVSFHVFTGQKTNWNSLESTYDKHVDIFKNKYGIPTKEVNKFLSPFDEYEGYEMIAVSSDNSQFHTYWIFSDYIFSVNITTNQEVMITYLNRDNDLILDKEKEEIY